MDDKTQTHLQETAFLIGTIKQEVIEKFAQDVAGADRVFLAGNGGSHSNASHFANDLMKAVCVPSICLSDMIPTLLAYANDDGYDFSFQNLMQHFFPDRKTLLVVFSCSGNSPNIVNLLKYCRGKANSWLLTGEDGGVARGFCRNTLFVPSSNIRIQESVHSAVCHAVVDLLVNDE